MSQPHRPSGEFHPYLPGTPYDLQGQACTPCHWYQRSCSQAFKIWQWTISIMNTNQIVEGNKNCHWIEIQKSFLNTSQGHLAVIWLTPVVFESQSILFQLLCYSSVISLVPKYLGMPLYEYLVNSQTNVLIMRKISALSIWSKGLHANWSFLPTGFGYSVTILQLQSMCSVFQCCSFAHVACNNCCGIPKA